MSAKWQIWVDTGGTFTDCIAIDPQGATRRVKVLSSSRMRGWLTESLGDGQFRIEHHWNLESDIFEGYQLKLPGIAGAGTFRVVGLDPVRKTLKLDRDIAIQTIVLFEISAGEEAPVLAARVATETPLGRPLPPLDMRLGFTKGTNALLERKGAGVALLITKGFADLPYIGTQQRPNLFQLNIPEPTLLYKAAIEVEERLDAAGNVLQVLTAVEEQRLVEVLRASGVEAVAVALMHSYRNPLHEQQLGQRLRREGFRFVSLSHELFPAIKLLPRSQTALVNAYLEPLLHDYLQRIQDTLEVANNHSTLLIMSSAGGLAPAGAYRPKDSLLSGPAGGVVGAARVARNLGFGKVLTLDMGGTSTDTARIEGRFDYRFLTRMDDLEIQSPCLAIETVAAGGGSICYFDGRKLCVGPESAGADPGPACYGAGGPLTITDVNLLLGKLDPSAMGIPIYEEPAREALLQLMDIIRENTGGDYSEKEILEGLERIANEKMADAIRRISVARGFDPSSYALLAFGGAGGLHACGIAELLGMETIILPFDAGLLSAFGMGKASVERFLTRQVLRSWPEYAGSLPAEIETLSRQARAKLEAEGFPGHLIEIREVLLFLRFKGQDSTLEIPFSTSDQILSDFQSRYRQLFGYFPEDRLIEVESIRVIAATMVENDSPQRIMQALNHPEPDHYHRLFPAGPAYPVFYWEQLRPGMAIKGPAILLNPTSTTFVNPDWELVIQADQNAVMRQTKTSAVGAKGYKEAIELELFTNRFSAIAEEMGAQLQRTAFSVNVKERLDFSCALLDREGELLVNAPHIPVHLGSLGICARLVREVIDLGPGDVVITNHPKYGGSHLPDVTLLSAVFADSGERIGYVINRAHHAEIGGKRPGSMPPDARTLIEEGVTILPSYLVYHGEPRWDEIERLLSHSPFPTRALAENLADLHAALASLRSGEAALQALVAEHGLEKVHHYMQLIKNEARQALAEALAGRTGQQYEATEDLDDGHRIAVSIQVKEEELLFDFSGTTKPHPFNLNANISIVFSAVIYVLRLLCGKNIPLNEGLMQKVRIVLPESFLHPSFSDDPASCPAVVGGNTEVSQRLVDTLLKAFGLAACSQGTMNNFLFGDATFGYYETIGGGCGAGQGFNGRSAVHQHMTNTRITDPEELEFRYPVRLHQFGIRRGSGGTGKWSGGNGIIREMEFLKPVEMTLLSQHRLEAPYGMEGGQPGKCGSQVWIQQNGQLERLNGIDSRKLDAGDRIRLETPGGGGFGHPMPDSQIEEAPSNPV